MKTRTRTMNAFVAWLCMATLPPLLGLASCDQQPQATSPPKQTSGVKQPAPTGEHKGAQQPVAAKRKPEERVPCEVIPPTDCKAMLELFPANDGTPIPFAQTNDDLCPTWSSEVEKTFVTNHRALWAAAEFILSNIKKRANPATVDPATNSLPPRLGDILGAQATDASRKEFATATISALLAKELGLNGETFATELAGNGCSYGWTVPDSSQKGVNFAARITLIPVGVKAGGVTPAQAICNFIALYHDADSFADAPTFVVERGKTPPKVSRKPLNTEAAAPLRWCWNHVQRVGRKDFFEFDTYEMCPGRWADFECFYWPTPASRHTNTLGIDAIVVLPDAQCKVYYAAFISFFKSTDCNAPSETAKQHVKFRKVAIEAYGATK